MRHLWLLSLIVLLLASPMAWAAGVPGGPGFIAHVDQAVADGRLSQEEGLLYKFHYGFDPDKLPEAYRPDTIVPLKNGTEIVWQYEALRAELGTRTVETIDAYLAPDNEAKATYDSPAGWFRLTYSTTGTDAVPATDTDPANGVPDYVEKVATYLDYSWQVEIIDNGFTAPPTSPYAIDFENMGYYGYTSPVTSTATTITLHNTFLGFPTNQDPEGNQWGAAKVTCAHEFKHASQRAQSYWTEGGWVELDATWTEDLVYDYVNDYYNYLSTANPIKSPTVSLDSGGTGSYEDCVWQHWMSEKYGNQIITDLWTWRHTHTSQAMISSYAQMLTDYGSSLKEGWADFTAWNYAVGSRRIAGLGYGEAISYPVGNTSSNLSIYPGSYSGSVDHLAANFVRCYNVGGDVGTVEVTFDGQNAVPLTLTAVIKKTDGTGVIERVALDGNNDAVVMLSVPMEEITDLGLVVANSHTTANGITYSLTVDQAPYVPQPTLVIGAASVAVELNPDALGNQPINLANNGEAGSSLDFTASIQPTSLAKAGDKSVAGSTVTTPTSNFTAGETVSLVFTVTNNSPDQEWLTDVVLDFPVGAVVNSSTAFSGGSYGTMTSDNATGDGARISWHGDTGSPNYYGVVGDGETASATINVSFDAGASGTLSIAYTITGDQWGSNPHTVTGTVGLAANTPTIEVIAPNGAESFGVGSDLNITWSASMMSEVKIDLSRNGGVDWESLTASTPNDGDFLWTITGPASIDCRMRVSSLDGVYFDRSNGSFAIYQPLTWLTVAPETGSIGQGENLDLYLIFDATGLTAGEYEAYLVLDHNAAGSQDVVPVTLTVNDSSSPTGDLPLATYLEGNYPNPFNPRTTIKFGVARTGPVTVEVLDLRGRLVKTLHTGQLEAGDHAMVWDGTDRGGRSVAAGTYLARMQSSSLTATSKMVLAK